jgi:hypothetical protein
LKWGKFFPKGNSIQFDFYYQHLKCVTPDQSVLICFKVLFSMEFQTKKFIMLPEKIVLNITLVLVSARGRILLESWENTSGQR